MTICSNAHCYEKAEETNDPAHPPFCEKHHYDTRREVVPGQVIKVTWWNGVQWYTTYEARPEVTV